MSTLRRSSYGRARYGPDGEGSLPAPEQVEKARAELQAQIHAEAMAQYNREEAEAPLDPDAVAMFEAVDRNHDDLLSHGELKQYLHQSPWAQEWITEHSFHWKDLFSRCTHTNYLSLADSSFLLFEDTTTIWTARSAGPSLCLSTTTSSDRFS